ncbi:selenide, water dikinase SelD [Marinicrinis sediminis]|uniref:Selenide, water dikinase n=1 Tax=Marinicrinis sediminis TaxID=1652465 RepID=A0ABW5R5U8_9BACL
MNESIKLTSLSSKGGCGCKIGPADLAKVLRQLPVMDKHPNLLVGLDTSDDAGVYKLTDELAIVQTLDFFTPIVDNPYDFGQIAAANALSDVYAMGGTPVTALNIVAFPVHDLDPDILAEILKGAAEKVKESGAVLAGGHSIDDKEPKFGLSVTGTIHPDRILTNAGAKPGDVIILTKPIGVGIMTTSLKRDQLQPEEIRRVTEVMSTLNKTASEIMVQYDVHACTDVTGFGLLGHALEMAKGSQLGMNLYEPQIPVLPRVRELAEAGCIPGGTKNNFAHVQSSVQFDNSIDQIGQWILCDAVTSGGLLISVAQADSQSLLHALQQAGVQAKAIGEMTEEGAGTIRVLQPSE